MRLVMILLLLVPVLGVADLPVPGHECNPPMRPADDVSERVWNQFLAGVDEFRACVSDFVASNHDAADSHRAVANAATHSWNDFVKASLNVPQDFPWPPE